MLSTTALKRNHLYEFRGQQLRYSHRSNCRVNAPFIFNDSKGRRKELSRAIRCLVNHGNQPVHN